MSTYAGDLAAWSDETAQRLRLRAFDEIASDVLIAEIREVGRS